MKDFGRNTADIDDEDALYLTKELEEAFDLKFPIKEIEHVTTVGDLYDLVVRTIDSDANARKCASAMAFYRLRAALRQIKPGRSVRVDTALAEFQETSVKSFFKTLKARAGLGLPGPDMTWIGNAGLVAILLAFPISILPLVILADLYPTLTSWGGYLMLSLFVAGCIFIAIDPKRFSADCTTVGALANKVAVLNYGRMLKQGARARANEIWDALTELLAEDSSIPREEMHRETVLLRSTSRAQMRGAA